MSRESRPDVIYPLTLAELAFIVIFLILLLTGLMVFKRDNEVHKTQSVLEHSSLTEEEKIVLRLVREEKYNPNEVISALSNTYRIELENRQLKKQIEALDVQLSALEPLKKIAEETQSLSSQKTVRPEVEAKADGETVQQYAQAATELRTAWLFKHSIEREQGEALPSDRLLDRAKEYVVAWRIVQTDEGGIEGLLPRLVRENHDLRGQAVWWQTQLQARGGRDYPPCWVEESTGKAQYVFTIELVENGLVIKPSWPPERESDALSSLGITNLVGGGYLSLGMFRSRVQTLDNESRTKQCRHYIRLVNRVRQLSTFNRLRYAVEEFFYKFEVR